MMTFIEWAEELERSAIRAKVELEVPIETVMVVAEQAAKDAIGTYVFGWQQLADSTQAGRAANGYAPNEPLLRDGELRGSIEHQVEIESYGASGAIGSHSAIALYQEIGTSRGIPPRSFLGEALHRSAPIVDVTFGRFTVSLLTFGGSK